MKKISAANYGWKKVNEAVTEGINPLRMSFPVANDWNAKGKRRVLVVLESVFHPDLDPKNARRLLGNKETSSFIGNLIEEAERTAAYTAKVESLFWDADKISYAFIHYNYALWFKSLSDRSKMQKLYAEANRRIWDAVAKLKPHDMLICGDRAAKNLLNDAKAPLKRGVPQKIQRGRQSIHVTTTVDVDTRIWANSRKADMSDNALAYANGLGYAARHMSIGLLRKNPYSLEHIAPNPKLVTSVRSAKAMLKEISAAKRLGVDSETETLSPFSDVLTVQFSIDEENGWVLPVTHKDGKLRGSDLNEIRSRLRKLFGNKRRIWQPGDQFIIGHNLGFDLKVLGYWLDVRHWYTPIWDTMSGEFCLDENMKVLETMDVEPLKLSQAFISYGNDYYFEADFSKEKVTELANENLEGSPLDYTAMDTQCVMGIQEMQVRRAKSIRNFNESSRRTEPYRTNYERLMLGLMSPMCQVLSIMENRGTLMNVNWMMELADSEGPLTKEKEELTEQLYATPDVVEANKRLIRKDARLQSAQLFGGNKVPQVFNIGKREHKHLLFIDVMGLDPLKKGKSGDPSFDAEFLEAYQDQEPVRLIQEIGKIQKLKSTYVDSYLDRMNSDATVAKDWRMRPSFWSVIAVSGRTSSSGPNMQNIPNRSESAKPIKKILVTPPWSLHIEGDFSIHEIRCWSRMSGDNVLMALFKKVHQIVMEHRVKQTKATEKKLDAEGDVHKQNYATFSQVPVNTVTSTQRQDSKGITFGTIYGMSDMSLGKRIKKAAKLAKDIKDRFFKRYKKAGEYLEVSEELGQKHYHIMSPLGRRRNLFGYFVPAHYARSSLDRMARNSRIQGFASDLGVIAAFLYSRAVAECMDKLKELGIAIDKPLMQPKKHRTGNSYMPYGPNCAVHDSTKSEAHFRYVLLHMHLMEWSMRVGVPEYVKDVFDYDFKVPLDIEIEIGSSWAQTVKWDWTDRGLDYMLKEAIKGHKEIWGDEYPAIAKLDTADTLARMKKEYLEQCEALDLMNEYPIPHRLVAVPGKKGPSGRRRPAQKAQAKRMTTRRRSVRSIRRAARVN